MYTLDRKQLGPNFTILVFNVVREPINNAENHVREIETKFQLERTNL